MFKSNRARTRDLLLEYDRMIMPPRPRAAGLGLIYTWLESNTPSTDVIYHVPVPQTAEFSIVYPWESISLSMLGDQIYILASRSGYTGTREEFHKYFGVYLENNRQEILFEEYNNFPQVGSTEMLYFDLNEKILYYWDNEYIPVNAMLIAHTILNGGEINGG